MFVFEQPAAFLNEQIVYMEQKHTEGAFQSLGATNSTQLNCKPIQKSLG